LILGVIWLTVVLALYRALEHVDRFTALLMLVLGGYMQVPLYFVNAVNYAGAFRSAKSGNADLTMLFIGLHHDQLLASLVFAGLWLFPFGMLVWKSRIVPRVLGIWLGLNGCAWLAVALFGFLAPDYGSIVGTVAIPLEFGEIVTALWLTIAPSAADG
jgi:hypothetical protein